MVSGATPPVEIPGYRIVTEIGRGGMASVYLAVQETLEREVALKLMSPALGSDPVFHQQFLSEGRIIAKLSHPCIVTIYEIGQVHSRYYMAMEYAPAGNLKERLRTGVSVRDALNIVRDIGAALGYAHARGFIHRDVKPANILFKNDGTAVLSDFGIAKSLDTTSDMTRMGFNVGTPSYMSPEQSHGISADPRSDLYSLGVVFLEMLTGSRLVQRNTDGTLAGLAAPAVHYTQVLEGLLQRSCERRIGSAERLLKLLEDDPDDVTVIYSAPPDWTGTATATDTAPSGTGPLTAPSQPALAGDGGAPPGVWPAPAPTRDWTGDARVADGGSVEALSTGATTGAGDVAETAGGPEPPRRRTSLAMVLVAAGFVLLAGVGYGFWTHYRGGATVEDAVPDPPPGAQADPPDGGSARSTRISQSDRERIERLLEVADVHLMVGRRFDPPGSNAFEAYQLVLEIDPSNSAALAGLAKLHAERN